MTPSRGRVENAEPIDRRDASSPSSKVMIHLPREDVIEEYTRPARYVRNRHVVTMPALSEPELINILGVGVLEAFNTDGLSLLLRTINSPDMKKKTFRYHGHAEKIGMLRETGFLSHVPVKINGTEVCLVDMTSRLLFHIWKLEEGEEEFTVMHMSHRREEWQND